MNDEDNCLEMPEIKNASQVKIPSLSLREQLGEQAVPKQMRVWFYGAGSS